METRKENCNLIVGLKGLQEKTLTTFVNNANCFLSCSALSSGLGNIVSQKIVKRSKGRRLEYRSVVAFTSFG